MSSDSAALCGAEGLRSKWHARLDSAAHPRAQLLQNQQIARSGFSDRSEWDAGIESDEPAFVLNREGKEVYVGKLPRSMDSRRIDDVRIQQSDFIRPEFMDIFSARAGEALNDSLDRQRVWIARIRHDTDTSVLCDRT